MRGGVGSVRTVEMPDFFIDTKLIKQFGKWLEQFDEQHARAWALLLHRDPEAAMCEATFWGILTDCGITVEPFLDLTGGKKSPDFRCQKDSYTFFVEVTCLKIETVTKKTHLEHEPNSKPQAYAPLHNAIWEECVSKTSQCAAVDAPCLLAVGTFHCVASMVAIQPRLLAWLLTGEPKLAWDIDVRTGSGHGDAYQITEFESSAFVRPGKTNGIEFARLPISGLLIGGFGIRPPQIFGLLHPSPKQVFAPSILSRIAFCKQNIDFQNGSITTEWFQKSDPMYEREKF